MSASANEQTRRGDSSEESRSFMAALCPTAHACGPFHVCSIVSDTRTEKSFSIDDSHMGLVWGSSLGQRLLLSLWSGKRGNAATYAQPSDLSLAVSVRAKQDKKLVARFCLISKAAALVGNVSLAKIFACEIKYFLVKFSKLLTRQTLPMAGYNHTVPPPYHHQAGSSC